MHQISIQHSDLVNVSTKEDLYRLLVDQVSSLFEEERDFIANMANCAALLYHTLPDLNWAGFYVFREDMLIVGPFQGKPACVRIEMGKGVCGTAAQHRETIRVDDVDQFPGHIACDSASRSEIVIPLLKNGQLIGVLDLDSPLLSRFDDKDAIGLETVVARFIQLTDTQTHERTNRGER